MSSSSPGYETSSSSSTAAEPCSSSSPDPCDYPQYEGGASDYKARTSKMMTSKAPPSFAKDSISPDRFVPKRPSITKIEDRLVNFELKSNATENVETANGSMTATAATKKDLPKVDITKRRELFEKDDKTADKSTRLSGDFSHAPMVSIKERLSNLEKEKSAQQKVVESKINVPMGSIKERLSSLQSAVNSTAAVAVGPKEEVSIQADDSDVPAKRDAVIVGMAKKLDADQETVKAEQPDVIQVETVEVKLEQIKLNGAAEPESLLVMDSIQEAVQEYVTVEQDIKVVAPSLTAAVPSVVNKLKEEFREITDEDLFGAEAGDIEIEHLQQDISVSSAEATPSHSVSNSFVINDTIGVGKLVAVDPTATGASQDTASMTGSSSLGNNSITFNFTELSSSNGGTDVDSNSSSVTVMMTGGDECGGCPSLTNTLASLGSLLAKSSGSECSSLNGGQSVSPTKKLDASNPVDFKVGGPVTTNIAKTNLNFKLQSMDNNNNSNNINNNSINNKHNSISPVAGWKGSTNGCAAASKTVMSHSVSDNAITTVRSNGTSQVMRNSHSDFFDSKAGDRHCILLINNNRQ